MHDPLTDDTMTRAHEPQLASAVLMIRPARFESNPQTLETNSFQEPPAASPAQQQAAAVHEFDGLVAVLRDAGIEVMVVDDTNEPHNPDAIFPNNWISTHADGRVVLYPMEAENRRTERRLDVVDLLARQCGRQVTEIIDLSFHEKDGHFLEGTGSLVLDRPRRLAYACLSSRTHLAPLGDFAQRLDYDVVAFDAVDADGVPIYHTNVLMSIGEDTAVICDAAIPHEEQREAIMARLRDSGHAIVSLDYTQLAAFAGNVLELRNRSGERIVAMSQAAHDALRDEQRAVLSAHARLVSAPIDTIETSAGGSVRCMLAEIHLPAEERGQV